MTEQLVILSYMRHERGFLNSKTTEGHFRSNVEYFSRLGGVNETKTTLVLVHHLGPFGILHTRFHIRSHFSQVSMEGWFLVRSGMDVNIRCR